MIALASESFESLQLFQYPLPPGSTELSSTETHAAGLTQREPITAERDLIQSPPDSCNGATFLFAGFRSDTANGHLNGERELEPKKRIAAQLVFSHLCNAVTEEVGHSKGIFYSMSSQLLRFSADSLRCYLFFDCKTETLPEAAKLVARLGANLADSLTHDSMAEITSQARAHLLKNRISLDRIEGTIVNAVAFSELRHISLKDEWNIIQSLTLEDLKAAAETLFGTPKNPRGDFSYWVPQQQRQTVQAHEDTLKHPWEKAGGNPLNTHATPHESTQLMKQSP